MVGVKGKSGKVVDLDHHNAKRLAGRKAGLAKRDNLRTTNDDDGHGVPPSIPGVRFPIKNWIDYKDHLQCELQKEKIKAAEIEVQSAILKRDLEAGAVLTRDQVRTRDESHAQAFRTGLQSVNELLTTYVPADRLLAAQKAGRDWVDGVLTKVAEAIGGKE